MPSRPAAARDARTLTDTLLQLHRGVQAVGFEAFQAWALELVKPLLRFETAIWGAGAGVEQGVAFINSVYLHRLPPQLMADYQPIRPIDPIAQACEAAPGQVVRVCLDDAAWRTRRYQPLQRYARQYGLVDNLCLAVLEPVSASHQFITLSRPQDDTPYGAADQAGMAQLAPHLLAAFALRRRLHLAESALRPAAAPPHGRAIVDAEGRLHEADPAWHALAARAWPQAAPGHLAEPLRAWLRALTSAPPAPTPRWDGTALVATAAPVHDLWVLTLRERSPLDELSEREQQVARHYATGSSHKQIAQHLGIAPATVRAHLRSVFQKLRIKDKVALIQRLV